MSTDPTPAPEPAPAPPPVPAPDPDTPPTLLPGEAALAAPMFFLAVIFLAVLGGILHRHKLPEPVPVENGAAEPTVPQEPHDPFNTELIIQLSMLAALWPIFFFEGLYRLGQGLRPRGLWGPLRDFLLVCLVPPWRLGQQSQGAGRELWLPRFGWRAVKRDLNRDLERSFGLPMIFIALLVLPLLVAEFFFQKQIRQNEWLQFLVEFGNALVWFAFALEFLVMLAVARHKFRYVLLNWLNLAIILLPFVHFLPVFRLLRLGQVLRLEQISRLGRLYRMQGLAMRAWRAFLLLQLIQRILGTSPTRQLANLRELEQAKLEDLEELRQEIAALEERIAREGPRTDDDD